MVRGIGIDLLETERLERALRDHGRRFEQRVFTDLELEQFQLLVDGDLTEIATLDRDCPVGRARDPRGGAKKGSLPADPTVKPRRIILVLDYFHMENANAAIEAAQDALDRFASGTEEHMLISLGDLVRIEAPFTADLDDIRWALLRMQNDRDLFARSHSRLTDHDFFER